MSRSTYLLHSDRERKWALAAVHMAPLGMQVQISKPKRTLEQNSLLHAVLSDIAEQVWWPPPQPGQNHPGEQYDIDIWKRLTTLAWMRERGQFPQVIPALDGKGFDIIVTRTSDLTTEECAELIEWCYAFGTENGVVFREPKSKPPPPDDRDYEGLA